ncbi:MAG: 4-alpha-glucanotransferase [Lachnospiraceae bacterium]|jgi:4-alpha-glucanotransferase|nr:4-alpha-glucanotransferase [Lachnospiraceae bacterium]MCI9133915.1 4-alpha-glucanotransferase [Lachnospiraceae bacterium]
MRASGVLLPVASLPGAYGIGCFSREAYEFVDFLKKSGQKYWQILPIGPTGYGDSPYQSFSTYAGNPYFIDLEELIRQGILEKEECEEAAMESRADSIDYEKLYRERFRLLRKAYERSHVENNAEFGAFVEKNRWWLRDYAIFMAVKGLFGGSSWDQWPKDIRLRYGYSMDYYQRELYFEIEFYEYIQFLFQKQWQALKTYANEQGIGIIGDIPIYVAFDSADAWAHPELFQFDENNLPVAVAGCPPDGFSATGQLWGNPLYRWEYHRATGFDWWIQRIGYSHQLYDVLRIDHFRGFDEYYAIPYGDETAERGHWEKGPGMELMQKIRERIPNPSIIAEDLGFMTESVRALVKDSGFPNMKVLEFAFDSREGADYLPYNYEKNCVVYTGTHDNETICQWFETISREDRALACRYLGYEKETGWPVHWAFIRLAQMSVAQTCIIPVQDYLGLGKEARTNQPSTLGKNWKWRLKQEQLTEELAEQIRYVTETAGRL